MSNSISNVYIFFLLTFIECYYPCDFFACIFYICIIIIIFIFLHI